jgi:histidine triad (HIT) family protein
MTTIFEKIVAGDIPSTRIAETEHCYAFLDINPASHGHTLVIPKKPYETMLEIPSELFEELMTLARRIARAQSIGLGADGVHVLTNIHEAAWQRVFHVHFHIIPRWHNDGLVIKPGVHNPYTDDAHRDEIAEKLRNALQ